MLNVLIPLSYSGRRFFFRCTTIIVTSVMAFQLSWAASASADDYIQKPDPTREWLGREYADTVIARVQKNHPELKLTMDVGNIYQMKSAYQTTLKSRLSDIKMLRKEGAKFSVQEQLVTYVTALLPPGYREFINALELGERITLDDNGDGLQAQNKLRDWISEQPDNSISPDEFMEKAILLSKGDLIRAWIAAWNVTSQNWIASSTRNYGHIQKFISMTGERHLWKSGTQYVVVPPNERKSGVATVLIDYKEIATETVPQYMEQKVTKRGDDFSYLYHRIGVELLTMVLAKQSNLATVGRAVGSIGALGEYFKYMETAGLWGENEKRIWNDVTAAESGARFFSLVVKNKKPKVPADQIGPRYYFRSNPKKFDHRYILIDGIPPLYFGTKIDPKFWQPSMSVEELRYRFHHATRYDAAIFNPVILASGDDYERLHRGLVEYSKSLEQDEKLNEYMQDYLKGMRGHPKEPDVKSDFSLDPWYNQAFVANQYEDMEWDEYEKRLKHLITRVLAIKRKGPTSLSASKVKANPNKIETLQQERAVHCSKILKN